MQLIASAKAIAKRHWPALSIRTILLATFIFVAALPGVGAVALRVYENTLVQQTEAELIAQGAVLAAAYRSAWGDPAQGRRPLAPEPPRIDLRADPVLPAAHPSPNAGVPDPRAVVVGRQLAPVVADAAAVTLAGVRLMDGGGIVVAGPDELGWSYRGLDEVERALAGRSSTVLRTRFENPYGLRSPLEWLSRAVTIRVHHARPVIVGERVVGVVMLSRSPRGLFVGIYQDRGKIALGVALILVTLLFLAGLLSRGIARPIRDLTRASNEVARGHVVIPDPPATAAVEIRDLYANFATMAERIEARERYLRDFAAAVSHEFKTPLTGIRGALELLAEHEMDEEQRRRFLANAGADAERLSRLVQRLLDLARADMGGAGDGSCDPVAVAAGLAEGADDIVLQSQSDLPKAAIAADTLATVLTILVENSRQAGAKRIEIDIGATAPGIVILCGDDGPGIPPADRDRIFEPFFTARRASGGTGLGLPIARSLLAAAGATISLVEADRGAKFAISLAAAP